MIIPEQKFSWIMTLSVESLSILYEEYEYSEKLGCGKFGSVYKVRQRETGKID